jgi:hypothetical protein
LAHVDAFPHSADIRLSRINGVIVTIVHTLYASNTATKYPVQRYYSALLLRCE